MGNNDKEGALGRMGQDLKTLGAVPGSGTSSLGDLLQVSWALWISSSNERTDLEALKPWESNLQFYSDTVSIRLTFPPNGPFLREYVITLRLPNKRNTKPDAVNSAWGTNRRLGLHFAISSVSMMTSYHRRSWPSEDQDACSPEDNWEGPACPSWHLRVVSKNSAPIQNPGLWCPRCPAVWGRRCHAKMTGQKRRSVKNMAETRQPVRCLGCGLGLLSTRNSVLCNNTEMRTQLAHR